MAKTKRELEHELRIYKAMYEKANKERMSYYFLLSDIANRFFYVAKDQAEGLRNQEYIIEDTKKGVLLNELINLIEELIKRGV